MGKESNMAKLKVTLVQSPIGAIPKQRATIEAMGLKKMHHSVELADTPATRGAVNKVSHLVTVEEL
jgi:large subunit ribosomal protein L30